jgi:hypothetical protein
MYTDYLPNNLGARLCSDKLRHIIDSVKTENDEIQWLDTIVKSGDDSKSYSILHFLVNHDVVDLSHSIVDEDSIIMPVLYDDVFSDRHLCAVPGEYGVRWYVSQYLKKQIVKANCTCISFTKM